MQDSSLFFLFSFFRCRSSMERTEKGVAEFRSRSHQGGISIQIASIDRARDTPAWAEINFPADAHPCIAIQHARYTREAFRSLISVTSQHTRLKCRPTAPTRIFRCPRNARNGLLPVSDAIKSADVEELIQLCSFFFSLFLVAVLT